MCFLPFPTSCPIVASKAVHCKWVTAGSAPKFLNLLGVVAPTEHKLDATRQAAAVQEAAEPLSQNSGASRKVYLRVQQQGKA